MAAMETDSICTQCPDVSRAGSNTGAVVTAWAALPPAPSYQEAHPLTPPPHPAGGKFLQQTSWIRGSDPGRGQSLAWESTPGTCPLDPLPFLPHKYVQ